MGAVASDYVRVMKNDFGVDVSEDTVVEALAELNKYRDIDFETLRGKYKTAGDTYILLAVENTEPHNGAWRRYIDSLKSEYKTVVIQSVVNKRLRGWFIRDGFTRTKKHKDWFIWRAE